MLDSFGLTVNWEHNCIAGHAAGQGGDVALEEPANALSLHDVLGSLPHVAEAAMGGVAWLRRDPAGDSVMQRIAGKF